MPLYDIEVIHVIKYKRRVRVPDENAVRDRAADLWINRAEPTDESVEVMVFPVAAEKPVRKTLTRNQQRFKSAKCNRCGVSRKGTQNGADLYLINDHCPDHRVQDQGSFCTVCLNRYTPTEWLDWFKAQRPELFKAQISV